MKKKCIWSTTSSFFKDQGSRIEVSFYNQLTPAYKKYIAEHKK